MLQYVLALALCKYVMVLYSQFLACCSTVSGKSNAVSIILCLWQAGAPVLGDGSHLVNPAVKRVVVEPSAVNQALHAQVRSIC